MKWQVGANAKGHPMRKAIGACQEFIHPACLARLRAERVPKQEITKGFEYAGASDSECHTSHQRGEFQQREHYILSGALKRLSANMQKRPKEKPVGRYRKLGQHFLSALSSAVRFNSVTTGVTTTTSTLLLLVTTVSSS